LAVNFTLENLSDEQKTTILQNKMADKNIHFSNVNVSFSFFILFYFLDHQQHFYRTLLWETWWVNPRTKPLCLRSFCVSILIELFVFSVSDNAFIQLYVSYIFAKLCFIIIPVRRGVLDTTPCDKVSQWLAVARWFSPSTPVSLHQWNWSPRYKWNFNNILVTSWRSLLLVEETGVPAQNHRPAASHWRTLSHKVVSSTSS
jgi:hypothetical protein